MVTPTIRHPLLSPSPTFDHSSPEAYWDLSRMTALYDVLAHFESTGPTTVLPFSLSVFETDGVGGR